MPPTGLLPEVGQLCFQQMAAKKPDQLLDSGSHSLWAANGQTFHAYCLSPALTHCSVGPTSYLRGVQLLFITARIAIKCITSYTTVDHQVLRKLEHNGFPEVDLITLMVQLQGARHIERKQECCTNCSILANRRQMLNQKHYKMHWNNCEMTNTEVSGCQVQLASQVELESQVN